MERPAIHNSLKMNLTKKIEMIDQVRKRKHVDEQEPTAEDSRIAKWMKYASMMWVSFSYTLLL